MLFDRAFGDDQPLHDLSAQKAVVLTVAVPWASELYGTLSSYGLEPEGTDEFTWGRRAKSLISIQTGYSA